jgi:hypothetical protein
MQDEHKLYISVTASQSTHLQDMDLTECGEPLYKLTN